MANKILTEAEFLGDVEAELAIRNVARQTIKQGDIEPSDRKELLAMSEQIEAALNERHLTHTAQDLNLNMNMLQNVKHARMNFWGDRVGRNVNAPLFIAIASIRVCDYLRICNRRPILERIFPSLETINVTDFDLNVRLGTGQLGKPIRFSYEQAEQMNVLCKEIMESTNVKNWKTAKQIICTEKLATPNRLKAFDRGWTFYNRKLSTSDRRIQDERPTASFYPGDLLALKRLAALVGYPDDSLGQSVMAILNDKGETVAPTQNNRRVARTKGAGDVLEELVFPPGFYAIQIEGGTKKYIVRGGDLKITVSRFNPDAQ